MIHFRFYPVVKRSIIFLAVVGVAALGGCSRDSYRASADRQVKAILADRETKALGYEPTTEIESSPDPKRVPKKAYAKIPLTPLPPVEAPAIEPSRLILPWGPLGPEMLLPEGVPAPEVEEGDAEMVTPLRRRPASRLVLGPPAPVDAAVKVDLFKSLEYAVQHSRAYQTQMEELYLAALNVTLERHLFSPRPFAGGSLTYEGGQQDVNYRSALVATATAGVRQRLPYGGEIVASGLVQFVDALNDTTTDGESAEIALTGTIPLLRGAGLVNLENLINSERQVVYAVREFEDFRRQFAIDVATQYFRILTAQQSVVNRRTNYYNFAQLLERTKALYQAGKLNFLQVQTSGASLYQAENTLIDAEAALLNTIDDFKLLIGMDVEAELQVLPSMLDVTVPDIDKRDVIKLAHTYRLDLQTRRDIVDDAARRVQVAANGLLPDLDLIGSGSIGNREGNSATRIDGRTGEYSAGVSLDLPVDRLAERNDYRRSLINLDRARRDLEQLKDLITADVRTRVRAIQSAEASLEIQTRSIELAQRRLEYATELLKEGKTTNSRDVVDAQQALLTAQDRYEDARGNLQIEILRFLRETGTLRVDPRAGALGHALDRISTDTTGRSQDLKPQ